MFETKKAKNALTKINLYNQYKKSKSKLLNGNIKGLDFKKRKPKSSNIYAFRINKQYRACGYFDDSNDFIVSYIDNHQ